MNPTEGSVFPAALALAAFSTWIGCHLLAGRFSERFDGGSGRFSWGVLVNPRHARTLMALAAISAAFYALGVRAVVLFGAALVYGVVLAADERDRVADADVPVISVDLGVRVAWTLAGWLAPVAYSLGVAALGVAIVNALPG